jgi:hypothetical protein
MSLFLFYNIFDYKVHHSKRINYFYHHCLDFLSIRFSMQSMRYSHRSSIIESISSKRTKLSLLLLSWFSSNQIQCAVNVQNQKIYVLFSASDVATLWNIHTNVVHLLRSIVFTSIAHLLVISICTSYAILFEMFVWAFDSNLLENFVSIVKIDINRCVNSWRKTIDYAREWSELLCHNCRELTIRSTAW